MKPETIHFNKPVSIIQAFHHHYDYHKDRRRFKDRKDEAAWQHTFQSISGYVDDGLLYLPESIMNAEGFANTNLITFEDIQNTSHYHFKQHPTNYCLNLQAGLIAYDNFKIKALGAGNIELHLNWAFQGFTDLQQYKIGELGPNSIIEIRRNRQVDFSGSGRMERTYTEAFTILQHLGTFTQATLLRPPTLPIAKPLPQPTKVVDLMKHLY